MTLSAIILTRDEEQNIVECLSSISFADEILVVDSGSIDCTVVLAEKHDARVVVHPFIDFAAQRNFAMSQAKGDWVLFIDADERVSPELAEEIKMLISQERKDSRHSERSEESHQKQILRHETAQDDENQKWVVYAIPRHNYFFGKRIRFGDAREDAPIRLFPRKNVMWSQPVHEMIVTDLPVRKLKNPLLHFSTRDFPHYRKKVREYVPLELRTMREKGVKPALWKCFFTPPAKFFRLYFLQGGILDGIAGFQYAILSAYYTFRKHWLYWKQKPLE